MAKSYYNSMITGNGSMLGCIDERGELIRLFWPNIDFQQNIEKFMVGILCPQLWNGSQWLSSDNWRTEQYYIDDTNIAVTEYSRDDHDIKVFQKDFVLPDEPIFVRCYEVESKLSMPLDISFSLYSSSVSSTIDTAGIMFDERTAALIHYRHGCCYSVSSQMMPSSYQLGQGSFDNAERGSLAGNDVIGMMHEGALIWNGMQLCPGGGRLYFSLCICMADNVKPLKALTLRTHKMNMFHKCDETAAYWRNYLEGAKQIRADDIRIQGLYKRSLLVFALMTDKSTGALLAAPEIDEEFTRCGRYAYCWGRDAALIAEALDRCGLYENTEKFYRWAAEVQDEDGSWQQRFAMDGSLAPSWGLQIDEGGAVIWGILRHYQVCGDVKFLADLWPCVKKGVEFLIDYRDKETGLPWLSFDLWEERLGEHAYSSAAVYAGIEAGAVIAEMLANNLPNKEQTAGSANQNSEDVAVESSGALMKLSEKWHASAAQLYEAILKNFWMPQWNRFIRSVRVKLNGWGEEHTDRKVWLKINEKSIMRDYSLIDGTVDVSMLGLCVPFGLLPADDPRMEETARVVEDVLSRNPAGGLMRYEYDGYIGGNPWIVTTLWAALYHIEKKDYKKALEYLQWAVNGMTKQGLLPEQVDKVTGRPAWVIPLTWSHAMFVLTVCGLMEAGEL